MTDESRVAEPTIAAGSIDAVAFDLDGTIYFGDELADGAHELLGWLTAHDIPYVFFTNNSGKTRAQIVAKLRAMDLDADETNTYTSGQATAEYARRAGWREVACIGTHGMRDMLAAAGVRSDAGPGAAEALVIALVPDFDPAALPAWLGELRPDVPIVAANMDMDYPVEGGVRKPGCGAIVRAVEQRLGREHDVVVGKPGTFMLDLLSEDHDLDRRRVLVVGDSLESDIAMARAAAAPSVLIDGAGEVALSGDHAVVTGLRGLLAALGGPES